MHQNQIDAIVIATGTSLNYFTGLRWGQSERFFAWTLPAKGAPFIVCPVFEEGRVLESGPPQQIFENPREKGTAEFLSEQGN